MKNKRKVGRPPLDRQPIIATVVLRLSKGEPLAQICREEGMPDDTTIRKWMQDDAVINRAIAQAREAGFDQIAMDALLIADEARNDYVETDEGPKLNAEAVMRSKLRVETRLKLLAKWDPKRYGENQKETTVNVGVVVNAMTEDRRKELQEKKRAAIERGMQARN